MNNQFESSIMDPTFIFVDGSYYNFYRYFALLNWWKIANPDDPLEDPFKNETFVEKFRKTHVDNLLQVRKKLKLDKTVNPIMIVGKDCKRENIWRMELFDKYKATRAQEGFMGGPFFKMAYTEELFQKGGAKAILHHPKLEADDCIAISVKHLLNKYPACHIYIITSDRDYLQLSAPNVHLYNLAYKNIAESKGSTGNPKLDLEIKIIMGDTSDNIPSAFPKCGPKTAQKCAEDPEAFKKKISGNAAYYAQYELNRRLVDFNCIPKELVEEFMATIVKNKKPE
jgi:5'-3' exonuclease